VGVGRRLPAGLALISRVGDQRIYPTLSFFAGDRGAALACYGISDQGIARGFTPGATGHFIVFGGNNMNKRLTNTHQPFAPDNRPGRPHSMRVGTTGTGKTLLLEVLAEMMNITVKELIQRFKLS